MHFRNVRIATLVLLTGLPAVADDDVFFLPLGDLPGGMFASVATAISADGTTVVGYSETDQGTEAFVWRDGVMRGLGDLPGGQFGSAAHGVSADGRTIVGSSSGPTQGGPVVWRDGTISALPLPAEWNGTAVGVSADGSVIAGYGSGGGVRWINGSYAPIPTYPGALSSSFSGVSADGSVIVGWVGIPFVGLRAFRWDGSWTLLDDLGEPANSQAWAVSGDGFVVVGSSHRTPPLGQRAVRWAGASIHELVNGDEREAFATSWDGSVIVGNSPAFIWTATDSYRELANLLTVEFGIDLSGWTYVYPSGISADGQTIVGHGGRPGGSIEAWVARIAYPRCTRSDLSFDSRTDLTDLAILLTHFGECAADTGFWPPADIDRRGCVDLPDLALLLREFGTECPSR